MCAILVRKTACQEIEFFPKNPDVDLIETRLEESTKALLLFAVREMICAPPRNRTEKAAEIEPRIHSGCKSYGFMIRYGICSNKTQNPFLDSKIRIWIFPKTRTLNLKGIQESS